MNNLPMTLLCLLFGFDKFQIVIRVLVIIAFLIFHIRFSVITSVLGVIGLLLTNTILSKLAINNQISKNVYWEAFFKTSLQRVWIDVFSYCILIGIFSVIFKCSYWGIGSYIKVWHTVALSMTIMLAFIYYRGIYINIKNINNSRHILVPQISWEAQALWPIAVVVVILSLFEALLVIINKKSLWILFFNNPVSEKGVAILGSVIDENIYVIMLVIVSLLCFIVLDNWTEIHYKETLKSIVAAEIMKHIQSSGSNVHENSIVTSVLNNDTDLNNIINIHEIVIRLEEKQYIRVTNFILTLTHTGSDELIRLNMCNNDMSVTKLKHAIQKLQNIFLFGNLPAFIGFFVLLIIGITSSAQQSNFIAGGAAMQMILGNCVIADVLKD